MDILRQTACMIVCPIMVDNFASVFNSTTVSRSSHDCSLLNQLDACLSMSVFGTIVVLFVAITKTCLYNFDPLKPHFYIVKLGFTGVYIIFFISARRHRLWYSLEPLFRGGSNEYPQSMSWAEILKISESFIWKCSVVGGEIVYIFEKTCLCNAILSYCLISPLNSLLCFMIVYMIMSVSLLYFTDE